MINRSFRLLLSLISFYVLCIMFFNALISHFKLSVNISLVEISVLLIIQIVSLVGLYRFNRLLIKVALGSESLLMLSTFVSFWLFRYFLGVKIISLVASGLVIGLLMNAKPNDQKG